MRARSPSSHSHRPSTGSAVVIMLVLVAFMTVLTLGTGRTLARLHREVIGNELRQRARVGQVVTNDLPRMIGQPAQPIPLP